MWNEPSWGNAGFLAWDVGAAIVPFVPASYVAKGLKVGNKALSKSDEYVEHFLNVKKDLEKRNYKITNVKNFWVSKNNPYNGLNATVRNDYGYIFELQFHTLESFNLKQGTMHGLYERYRVLPLDSKEAIELKQKMFELSGDLEIPKNIEVI